MQWLGFTKVENVMLKMQTAEYEPFNDVEDREEISGDRKHPWLIRAWKKTECPFPSTPQKHELKAAPLPTKSPCLDCRILATAAGVSKSTMHQVLRDDLGVKPFKMVHRQELTDNNVAMRAQKSREILQKMADGILPNLVLTDEKKFNI